MAESSIYEQSLEPWHSLVITNRGQILAESSIYKQRPEPWQSLVFTPFLQNGESPPCIAFIIYSVEYLHNELIPVSKAH